MSATKSEIVPTAGCFAAPTYSPLPGLLKRPSGQWLLSASTLEQSMSSGTGSVLPREFLRLTLDQVWREGRYWTIQTRFLSGYNRGDFVPLAAILLCCEIAPNGPEPGQVYMARILDQISDQHGDLARIAAERHMRVHMVETLTEWVRGGRDLANRAGSPEWMSMSLMDLYSKALIREEEQRESRRGR